MTIRVLLADDHLMVRDALAALIAREPDMEIVALARDGREAILHAQVQRPDIALLDVSMPEINGIEAASQLRRSVPQCRVIALTALPDDCFMAQMRAAGARAYVLKSESGTNLVATIREVVAGRDALAEQAVASSGASQPLLSRREREVLEQVAAGRRGRQIAEDMGVAVKTVDTYRRRIMQKLGLSSQTELVRYALALGVAPEPRGARHQREPKPGA